MEQTPFFFTAQGKSFTYQQDRRKQEDCSPIDRLQAAHLGFNNSQPGMSFSYTYSFGVTNSSGPVSTDEKRVVFNMGEFNAAGPDQPWTAGDPLQKDTVAGIIYDSVSYFTIQKYHNGKGYTYSTVSFKPGVGFLKFVINNAQAVEIPVYTTYEWIR